MVYADEAGVSSVVGTVLMLAVTIAVFGGLAVFVVDQISEDTGPPRADLGIVQDGQRTHLVHRGGESLAWEGRLIVNIQGIEETVPLSDLRDQAGTDRWQVGGSLCLSGPKPACHYENRTVNGVTLVHGGAVVVEHGARGGPNPCPADTTAPGQVSWSTTPANVKGSTIGDVAVTAVFSDACPGVDQDARPVLRYRLNGGLGGAWQSAGTMQRTAADTWSGSIPDPVWELQGAKVLEAYVEAIADLNGNTGDGPVSLDLIEPVVFTYVASHTDHNGTTAGFSGAQAANDAASATLTEGVVQTTPTTLPYAADAHVAAPTWSSPHQGLASDDKYASTTDTTAIRYTVADPDLSGPVTGLVVKAEVSIAGYNNDAWRLRACLATCTESDVLPGSAFDVTVDFNATALRPGGGSWTWADVADLAVEVVPVEVAGTGPPQDGTWRVDAVYVEATYPRPSQVGLDFEGAFSAVPAGPTHTLQLRYAAAGDAYLVEVWNGSAFVAVGPVLDATSMTGWSHALSGDEYAGGAPRFRIVDATVTGPPAASLDLDYARVVTE